jgi:hypothetical protein
MRKILLSIMGAALIAGTGALTVPASAAPPLTCTGTNSGIYSSVIVPSGFTCYLEGATVNGSVTVQPGGRLAVFGSTIKGSVNSDRAGTDTNRIFFSIVICESSITGSVTITRATSNVFVGDPDVGCDNNTIGGSVTLNSNDVGPELINNKISGSVTVNSNQGVTHDDPQSAHVQFDTITGALNCAGNVNGVKGGVNTAAAKTGQCAAL